MAPHVLALPFQEPYDFEELLRFLRARTIDAVEHVTVDSYTRSFSVQGLPAVLTVERATSSALRATIYGAPRRALALVERSVRGLFDLDAQPSQINARLRADPALAALVQERPGLRVPGAYDGLELCVRGILGQQITVRAAIALCAQLVRAHGTPLPSALVRDQVTHLFPSPEQLRDADLSHLKIPGARRIALTTLARSVCEAPQLLEPQPDLQASVRALCTLRGIGPWTAQYIAMRWLKEADAFPEGDVGLLRALRERVGAPIDKRELLRHAEQWRPYRAYAAVHLWSSLRPA